jgi:quinol monooxygenase YgiN
MGVGREKKQPERYQNGKLLDTGKTYLRQRLAVLAAAAGRCTMACHLLVLPAMLADTDPALRHVVLFAFKPDADSDAVEAVVNGFAALPAAIPGIAAYEWGTNVSPEGLNDGFTHCFTLTFASAEARDDYLNHPEHVRFVKTLGACLAKSLVLDYWVQGGAPAA